jgi:glycosyltransferase involved in cell wall biosynthesis
MDKGVVIVNQNAGYLAIDIANAFVTKSNKTVLIAGMVIPMERKLHPSVRIQKIIKYNRSSTFMRITTWIWGSIQVFLLLLFKYRLYEVIYTTNPPLACFSSLLVKQNFSIIIYDTYPDTLKNIGINENNIIYRLWSRWIKIIYKKSEKIITLSNGMAEQLNVYTERSKIKVIPNWSGSDGFTPIPKAENPFIKEHKLENKFIVLYSGNIGYSHSLEAIIDAAKSLKSEENICFLIIGEGSKKEILVNKSRQYNLKNCMFLSWQPFEILPYSLASADLAVITLNDENAVLSVPSKTYNLLAVGCPLLCLVPDNSELALLVEKYKNGKCFNKDSVPEITEFIASLSKNKALQQKLSVNSVDASRNFSYTNAQKYL